MLCDQEVTPPGSGDKLDPEGFPLGIFFYFWEMLLTGHAVLEQEERSLKPLGVFPGLPCRSKFHFSPGKPALHPLSPWGRRQKSHFMVLGGKSLVPPRAVPLLLVAAPQAGMSSQGKGLTPSQPWKAAGRRSLQDALCVWVLQTLRGGCLWLSSVPRLPADPAQAFRMILPGFLQSRYLSLRTECTRGLQKLEGADLLVLLVGNKARTKQDIVTGMGQGWDTSAPSAGS